MAVGELDSRARASSRDRGIFSRSRVAAARSVLPDLPASEINMHQDSNLRRTTRASREQRRGRRDREREREGGPRRARRSVFLQDAGATNLAEL